MQTQIRGISIQGRELFENKTWIPLQGTFKLKTMKNVDDFCKKIGSRWSPQNMRPQWDPNCLTLKLYTLKQNLDRNNVFLQRTKFSKGHLWHCEISKFVWKKQSYQMFYLFRMTHNSSICAWENFSFLLFMFFIVQKSGENPHNSQNHHLAPISVINL